jgi:hypothetical protein
MRTDRQEFDSDHPEPLGKSEEDEIDLLSQARMAKFVEIVTLIAVTLGYNPNNLSKSQLAEAEEQAEEACEAWGEQAETPELGTRPVTSLQALLRKHWSLGEKILEIQESVIARNKRDDDVV